MAAPTTIMEGWDRLGNASPSTAPRVQQVEIYYFSLVSMIPGIILVPIVSVVGMIGNAICLAVFRRQRKSTSAHFLLQVLSILDFLFLLSYLVLYFPNTLIRYIYGWPPVHIGINRTIYIYTWLAFPIINIVEICTVYTIVVLTLDR
jgi:hypothetical protein